jgi:ketosteroid isomerase-like protein
MAHSPGESPSAEEVLSQNVDAIRRAYEAVGSGDFDIVLDIVDPDIVLRDRPESPDPRTYHGYDGVRQALESSDESFDGFELHPEEFIAAGDYVIVVLTMRGTGRGSGVTVEDRIAHQWQVKEGRVVALQVYSDPDEAVRDARASA